MAEPSYSLNSTTVAIPRVTVVLRDKIDHLYQNINFFRVLDFNASNHEYSLRITQKVELISVEPRFSYHKAYGRIVPLSGPENSIYLPILFHKEDNYVEPHGPKDLMCSPLENESITGLTLAQTRTLYQLEFTLLEIKAQLLRKYKKDWYELFRGEIIVQFISPEEYSNKELTTFTFRKPLSSTPAK